MRLVGSIALPSWRPGRRTPRGGWRAAPRHHDEYLAQYAVPAEVLPERDLRGAYAELFVAHEGRLVDKWLHYLEVYDRHLAAVRGGMPQAGGGTRPLRLLEIGVFQGGSLELWRRYLGPEARITGVDIDPRCARFDREHAAVRIGSQDDPAFLRRTVQEMGGVDVVIDDGSHVARHQRVSFATLFPLLSDGGLYIVEDLHAAYWAPFGGGVRRKGTFIEVAKDLVDGMHAWYYPSRRLDLRQAKEQVFAVSFYDSMAVIEKRLRRAPETVRKGTPSW